MQGCLFFVNNLVKSAKSGNRDVVPLGFETNEEMENFIVEGKDQDAFLFGILFKESELWNRTTLPKQLYYAFRPVAIPR